MQATDYRQIAVTVLKTEAKAIQDLTTRITDTFTTACQQLLGCTGRIVVTGMGKSGHIGRKIAATLASTGSPAFFLHPGEASHGDMGMITSQDVVLAISYSGYTQELVTLLPLIKHLGVVLITITGNATSTLAESAWVNLDVKVSSEACPLGLAPTASTTCTLALGDALAIALQQARGFTVDDFARAHPGGSLGRRLLLRVEDIMHHGDAIPKVKANTLLSEALVEVTAKKLGITTIVDHAGQLIGVFTDGDLRRTLDAKHDIHNTLIQDVMTQHCKTIAPSMLAAKALQIMEAERITTLIVIDTTQHPLGILHMHDLLSAGVI
jgi:arabinose-5-phosphate isomerase